MSNYSMTGCRANENWRAYRYSVSTTRRRSTASADLVCEVCQLRMRRAVVAGSAGAPARTACVSTLKG